MTEGENTLTCETWDTMRASIGTVSPSCIINPYRDLLRGKSYGTSTS